VQVGTYPTRNFATLGIAVTSRRYFAERPGRFSFRLALHVAVEIGPYLRAVSQRVWRMASEDSVDDILERSLSLLAVVIH